MNEQDRLATSDLPHSDQWRKLAFESYCFSALCSPAPPSVGEAMESYTKEWGDALCYMLSPLDKLEQVRREADRLGYLDEGDGVNDVFIQTTQTLNLDDSWQDQVADAIADILHHLADEGFVHGAHRLWLDDTSRALEVEKFVSSEVSRQTVSRTDPFIRPCIGFLPSINASQALETLLGRQCAIRLNPVTSQEIGWVSEFLQTAKSRNKDLYIAGGDRPTQTRQLEDGRFQIGWLNLRLAQAVTFSDGVELLGETRPEAIRIEADKVVWKDQPIVVESGLCLYDSDLIRDVDSELATFGR